MTSLASLAERVRQAAPRVAQASTEQKNEALRLAASNLVEATPAILEANENDLAAGAASGATPAVLDRLRLDPNRVEAMAAGLLQVATLPDPVGEVVDGWVRPNGLQVRRVRVPLGVIGVIYENRPNVTSDAAGLCIKSGNAAFLRGSSGAINSNIEIAKALRRGLVAAGLPEDAVALVEDTSRESAVEFMQLRGVIDCLIPRGGPSLIASILENATVPFIVDGDGNCHVYVDATAELDMAERIVVNAKTQRPSVCNAAESLVLHESIAAEFIERFEKAAPEVELIGDETAQRLSSNIAAARDDDFSTEFLALKMSVAVVPDLDAAIAHVNRHGSGHSEAIVTRDVTAAQRFTREVDAAAVVVNASTRFVDGEQLGFGAEIGISTQKLHCRGPMGLRELTTLKYVIEGEGQIRT